MPSPAAIKGRALRASPVLRAVADTPIAQRVIQTERAVRLLEPAARLLAGRHGIAGRYRLRRSDSHVHVRHRTRDLDILAEIFTAGSYEPPSQAAALLDGPLRIADLGGNIGLFGIWALERWEVAGLRSYEPDPANARLLVATAEPFREWAVVEAAVGNGAGTIRFAEGMLSESRAALDGEGGIAVPVVDLFSEPEVDLVKIDIEGGEWTLLEDPRLAGLAAGVIVMEWHRLGCPDRDPRGHVDRLLERGGYTGRHHLPGRFDSNGTVWAWRTPV